MPGVEARYEDIHAIETSKRIGYTRTESKIPPYIRPLVTSGVSYWAGEYPGFALRAVQEMHCCKTAVFDYDVGHANLSNRRYDKIWKNVLNKSELMLCAGDLTSVTCIQHIIKTIKNDARSPKILCIDAGINPDDGMFKSISMIMSFLDNGLVPVIDIACIKIQHYMKETQGRPGEFLNYLSELCENNNKQWKIKKPVGSSGLNDERYLFIYDERALDLKSPLRQEYSAQCEIDFDTNHGIATLRFGLKVDQQ